jgi:nucleosome binding factor SPN SPT16 subunit
MENKNKLFEWYLDCGRMGSIQGVFVASQDEVDEAVGKRFYLGEVLGKHSEVYGEFDANELSTYDVSDAFVEEFSETFPNGFGFNPFDYINSEDE